MENKNDEIVEDLLNKIFDKINKPPTEDDFKELVGIINEEEWSRMQHLRHKRAEEEENKRLLSKENVVRDYFENKFINEFIDKNFKIPIGSKRSLLNKKIQELFQEFSEGGFYSYDSLKFNLVALMSLNYEDLITKITDGYKNTF